MDCEDTDCNGKACSGGTCQNGVCVAAGDCDLISAEWYGLEVGDWCGFAKAANVNAGSEVTLRVRGSTGCQGRTVDFKLQDWDASGTSCNDNCFVINPEQVSLNIPSATFNNCDDSGCIAERKWSAVWVHDGGGGTCDTGDNPEYLFIATVGAKEKSTFSYLRVIRAASLSAELSCGPECSVACGAVSQSPYPGHRWFYFSTNVSESKGVDVTVTKRCVSGSCGGNWETCTGTLNRYVSGNNYLDMPSSIHISNSCPSDSITETIYYTESGSTTEKSIKNHFTLSGC
jgi:hypothetical protein